ncbi:MAG: response regulator [Chloroflexi bacterium]|nr:response regulator [Chloroflexota bacterium]
MTKILIAEDQDDLRDMIAQTLRLSGYEVVEAEDGERAYKQAQFTHPDLIILDYDMPRLNGSQVCKRLKAMKAFSNTPIVIISSYGNPFFMEASLAAGAEEFIRKPFELNYLTDRVDALLTTA